MKSLKSYLFESQGSQFKHKENISMKQWEKWKKKHIDDFDIVYSEADKLYAVYFVKDKSNPVWKGEHIGTYDCASGNLWYDNKEAFNDVNA